MLNTRVKFILNIQIKFILLKNGIRLIPDFGMLSVVFELYQIWYEIHTFVFTV